MLPVTYPARADVPCSPLVVRRLDTCACCGKEFVAIAQNPDGDFETASLYPQSVVWSQNCVSCERQALQFDARQDCPQRWATVKDSLTVQPRKPARHSVKVASLQPRPSWSDDR